MTRGFSGEFAEAVREVVAEIPPGRVMSYGDVAAAIGSRAARGVGAVMAAGAGGDGWWRVVRADGRPAECHDGEALALLRSEGTPLTASGRVAMAAARWRPEALPPR